MVEAGIHVVSIDIVHRIGPVGADVVRGIEVPFDVPLDGEIEIASISASTALKMPSGRYLVRCEFLRSPDAQEHVRILFSQNDQPRFAIACADPGLTVPDELLTEAEAAPG
jgi:hypothetical protein